MNLRKLWALVAGEETPDLPTTFCYVCKRRMKEYRSPLPGMLGVRVCPVRHYFVVGGVGLDVRASPVLGEALPGVKALTSFDQEFDKITGFGSL